MPKQIQAGKLTQALQRAFGFKGRYIPMLDEVVVPVYVIADPSPAEVTRLCAATFVTASFGTFQPYIQLFNPVASGIIINVTTVVVMADVKVEISIRFFDTPGPESGSAFFRDRRNPGSPAGQMRRDSNQAGLVGNGVATIQVDGALSQTAAWIADSGDPRQPLVVLEPGQGVIAQSTELVNGVAVQANFRWLELPITELNPIGGLPG